MRVAIILISALFWLAETNYFGWNLSPQSDAELICDGLALLMLCIGLIPAAQVTVNVDNQTRTGAGE